MVIALEFVQFVVNVFSAIKQFSSICPPFYACFSGLPHPRSPLPRPCPATRTLRPCSLRTSRRQPVLLHLLYKNYELPVSMVPVLQCGLPRLQARRRVCSG